MYMLITWGLPVVGRDCPVQPPSTPSVQSSRHQLSFSRLRYHQNSVVTGNIHSLLHDFLRRVYLLRASQGFCKFLACWVLMQNSKFLVECIHFVDMTYAALSLPPFSSSTSKTSKKKCCTKFLSYFKCPTLLLLMLKSAFEGFGTRSDHTDSSPF